MTYSNPILNALLAAVLGVLGTVYWSWDNPSENKGWIFFVAISCAVLGYHFGEPFIKMLIHAR